MISRESVSSVPLTYTWPPIMSVSARSMLRDTPPVNPFSRVTTTTPNAIAPASSTVRFFCLPVLRKAMRS